MILRSTLERARVHVCLDTVFINVTDMLVYRRRDSTSATPVSVPHYLIDEIEKENERVKVRREEIKREKELEELRNTVKQMHVHVYLPSAFGTFFDFQLNIFRNCRKWALTVTIRREKEVTQVYHN
jgi:hypothetical protein